MNYKHNFNNNKQTIFGQMMGWVFTDEMRFYLHDNETLLEGMIRTGHKDVRFECGQGYCGSCRMQLRASTGEISYCHQPVACLADNEVLACCCLANGTMAVSYCQNKCASLKFAQLKTAVDP